MNDGLPEHEATLCSGDEPFHGQETTQPLQLNDYWRWSASMLLDNTVRGILAEFLVASALDQHRNPRREWDEADVFMESGTKIEVKSAAYVQSWEQSEYSKIIFGIAPHGIWDATTGKYSEIQKRSAQIYVFCVFNRKEAPFDPLDLSAWDFYVIPTKVLDLKMSTQKSIGLSSLKKLSPKECSYAGLREAISEAEKEVDSEDYSNYQL